MHLPPREFDKLLICMVAEVALNRKEQGIKHALGPRAARRGRRADTGSPAMGTTAVKG